MVSLWYHFWVAAPKFARALKETSALEEAHVLEQRQSLWGTVVACM